MPSTLALSLARTVQARHTPASIIINAPVLAQSLTGDCDENRSTQQHYA